MGGNNSGLRRALAAGAVVVAAATAAGGSAVADDLDTARAEAQAVADEISTLGRRLDGLDDERDRLADDIEAIHAQMGEIELAIDEADEDYQAKVARLQERAVEAYKAGSSASLTLLLSADNLTEMYTISEALSEAASLDQEVLDDVIAAKTAAERAQTNLDDKKQRLMDATARKDALADDIEDTIAERDDVLERLNDHVAELEREARAEARAAEESAEVPEWTGGAPAPTWGTHDPDRLDGTGPADGIPAGFETTGVSFEGEASWYGPGFEGNTTANGDIFDSSLYTVASKTLPFGTYLYVTYGGRGVVVYVNDRGPYAGDRILDLSRAAAASIGISGVGWVRAEIIVKAG